MFVTVDARSNGDSLLAGLFFAGVIECGWPVVEVVVFVDDAGEQEDGAVWAGGDPVAVTGESVIAQ